MSTPHSTRAPLEAARSLHKGQQTRAAILDAALGLASQMGLEGLSIGALAEVAGMSKSGVFAHFGSREELQISVVREYFRHFERESLEGLIGRYGTLALAAFIGLYAWRAGGLDLTSLGARSRFIRTSLAVAVRKCWSSAGYCRSLSFCPDPAPARFSCMHQARLASLLALACTAALIAQDPVKPAAESTPAATVAKPKASELLADVDNRLVALDAAVAKRGIVQRYGLSGPVSLTPWRKAD